MKEIIGILTHCVAINYGANLQALSTGLYLKNLGYEPVFIQWEEYIENRKQTYQSLIHKSFIEDFGFIMTEPCKSDADFIEVIKNYSIKKIIVGSDCVLTYESHIFPFTLTKCGFKKIQISQDYKFPNPFWLPFLDHRSDIATALMSASAGSSSFSFLLFLKSITSIFSFNK